VPDEIDGKTDATEPEEINLEEMTFEEIWDYIDSLEPEDLIEGYETIATGIRDHPLLTPDQRDDLTELLQTSYQTATAK